MTRRDRFLFLGTLFYLSLLPFVLVSEAYDRLTRRLHR